jgi:hypothetical protein
MNGRDLTLGALAGLAVAGLVKQRSGSRSLPAAERTRVLREVTEKIQDEMQRVGWWTGAYKARVKHHDRPTAWDINDGFCEEWAEAAVRRIGGDAEVVDLASLRYEKFGLPDDIFEDVAHVVLLLDGRFYDAQDIEGVDDPRQLQLVRGVSRQQFVRGSAARDPHAPLRALGYTDREITRALAAAGQGPAALERGDDTTQTAGPTQEGAYPGLDFRPPPEVRKEALRGLQLRKENERRGVKVDPKTGAGPGGWWIGVGRAIQLATLPAMPPREITRMRDYFRRHAADVKSAGAVRGQATPGVVAWLLWGGDASRDWSRDLAGQMDRMDAEREGGRKGARFARGETGGRAKHPRTGSRALAARGARLDAEMARRPRRTRRSGSRNADPTKGLSDPLRMLFAQLDLTEDQKPTELAYQASWLLWTGLSKGGHNKLAKAYKQSDYNTEAILPRIKDELGEDWLRKWYDDAVPQLLRNDAAEAPSFLFFEEPKVLRNVWLVHFTHDAYAVERQGFRHGIDDPRRVGLTTHFSNQAKQRPGYVFAFRPEDVIGYALNDSGRPKYGKEAVLFRADAVFAWHTSDDEPQAIAWGPDIDTRIAVTLDEDGISPVVSDHDGEDRVFDSFPALVSAIESGRVRLG